VLYHLLFPLADEFTVFNVFRYITFRAAGAVVTALLFAFIIGPSIIRQLRARAAFQGVRSGTPESHSVKQSTPSMGGIIIVLAGVLPTLLWARLDNRYVWIAMLVMLWMAVIGFVDDWLKLKQRREGKTNQGLVERYKLVGQISVGIVLGIHLLVDPISTLPGASTTLPFFKTALVVPISAALAWWIYVPFVTFVLTGTSNAVNLTDGLDGLAAGLCAIALGTFAIFAYVMGRTDASTYLQIPFLLGAGELTVFCAAVFGACLGFLWFNSHPAEVIMGDTGALSLGGALGAVAILLKSEFLLLIVGGVFAMETLSVILQRLVFKYRRMKHGVDYARANRLFLRAPIHHHFELKGWPETQVVVRFWLLGALCAFVALSTLKLR
jgi:phospho-N-acetylmuramoyl-pentapeptide-transferase